jgi:hypothetical protein
MNKRTGERKEAWEWEGRSGEVATGRKGKAKRGTIRRIAQRCWEQKSVGEMI